MGFQDDSPCRNNVPDKPKVHDETGKKDGDIMEIAFKEKQKTVKSHTPQLKQPLLNISRQLASLKSCAIQSRKMFTCQLCSLSFHNFESIISHINKKKHSNASKYTCDICKIDSLDRSTLVTHNSGFKHSTNLNLFAPESKICIDRPGSNETLEKLILKTHTSQTPQALENKSSYVKKPVSSTAIYICEVCHHRVSHIKTDMNSTETYKCKICMLNTSKKGGIRQSASLKPCTSQSREILKCKSCNLSFYDFKAFILHVQTESHPKSSRFTCTICKVKDIIENDILLHIKGSKHSKNLKLCAS